MNNYSSSRSKKTILFAIISLAWPTILEQALHTIVQYVDTAMVGQLGASATASIGVTTTVTWLMNCPAGAFSVAIMAKTSQYLGAKDEQSAKKLTAQSVFCCLLIGSLMTILTLSVSPFLPGWMGAEESLRASASSYFFLFCTPTLLRTFSIVFGSTLRAAGDARTPMAVNIIMNFINIVLNYLFIYDPHTIQIGSKSIWIWGAGWGVTGAAAATAISVAISGFLMILAVLHNRRISPRGQSFRPDKTILAPCLKIAFPVLLERIASCSGQVIFASLVNPLGTISVAAHSIALTAEQAFYIPGFGMQASASTLSGNALGAKDKEMLRQVSHYMLIIILILMSITGSLLFIFAPGMMKIFTNDSNVIELGTIVLRIVAVSEPIYGVSIILNGIFSGVGDTLFPFYSSMAGMWGVRIIGTLICVKVLMLQLPAVWVCMVAGNVCTSILLIIRYLHKKWIPSELRF